LPDGREYTISFNDGAPTGVQRLESTESGDVKQRYFHFEQVALGEMPNVDDSNDEV